MSRREFVALSAAVVGTGVFAACQASPAPTPKSVAEPTTAAVPPTKSVAEPTTAAVPPTATPPAPRKRVVVNHWHNWAEPVDQNYLKFVERFNQANPEIEVRPLFTGNMATTLEKVLAAIAAGEPPQIANGFVSYTPDFADSGVILSAQEFLIDKGGLSVNDLYPVVKQGLGYKGQIWAIPVGSVPQVLFCNKTLFAKAGVSKPPENWDELLDVAKKCTIVKDGAAQQWGISITPSETTLLNFHFQNGGRYFSEDGTRVLLNDAAGQETLQYLVDLILVHKVAPPDLASGENPFKGGLLAMHMTTSTGIMRYRAAKLDFLAASIPYRKERKSLVVLNVWYVFKNIKPEERDATWKYVEWFVDPKTEGEWIPLIGHLPVHRTATSVPAFQQYLADNPELEIPLNGLDIAISIPPVRHYAELQKLVNTKLEEAMRGKKSVKDVLAEIELEGNKLLAG
jgi:sn-glycerol 3-phosphate transport system substrate-binding protein